MPNGSVAAGRPLKIELTKNDFSIEMGFEGTVEREEIIVTLDGSGLIPDGTILWCNSDGHTGSLYCVTEPDGAVWYFTLAYGATPIDITVLRAAGTPSANTIPVYAYINQLFNDLAYYDSLTDAITAIGSVETCLRITSPYTHNTVGTLVIPSNINLMFCNDGMLIAGAVGVNIQINNLTPLGKQIFDGAGDIVLGKNAVDAIDLTWWAGTSNANDVTHELEQAIASLALQAGGRLKIPAGEWRTTGGRYDRGTRQVETQVVAGGCTGSGTATVVVTAVGMRNSPITVSVPVTTGSHSTAALVASEIKLKLKQQLDVSDFFLIEGAGANVVLTSRYGKANDGTMNFSLANGTATFSPSITSASSTNTTAGVAPTDAYTNGLRLPNGATLEGVGQSPSGTDGSILRLTDAHYSAFLIGYASSTIRDVIVKNLTLKVDDSSVGVCALVQGQFPNSGFGTTFDSVTFLGGEIGLLLKDHSDMLDWQIGQVVAKNCNFIAQKTNGIYCDLVNSYLSVKESLFQVADQCHGIYLMFVGAWKISNCEFAGAVPATFSTGNLGDYDRLPTAGGRASVVIAGQHVAGVFEACQDEAMQYSLIVRGGDPEHIINCVGSLFQGYIICDQNYPSLNFIGNQIPAFAIRDSTANIGSGARVSSFGNRCVDALPGSVTPVGSTRVIQDFVSVSQMVFDIDSVHFTLNCMDKVNLIFDGVAFFGESDANPWIRIGGTKNEKPLLRVTRTDSNFVDSEYIDIERNATGSRAGQFQFIGSQVNFTGFDFNGRFSLSTVVALANTDPCPLDARKGSRFTLTPSLNLTINPSDVVEGQRVTLEVVTSGATSYDITFGANFLAQGVLSTGIDNGKTFKLEFEGNAGGKLVEIGARGIAM